MSPRTCPPPTTRRRLLASTTALLATLAGCSYTGDETTAQNTAPPDSTTAHTSGTAARGTETTEVEAAPLTFLAPGTLYPVVRRITDVWNRNPSPSNPEHWSPGEYGLSTDLRLADHFASDHGFEPTGERARPPFELETDIAGVPDIARQVANGEAAVGGIGDETPADLDLSADVDDFETHTIARRGSVFVVSPALYEAGVDTLTREELRDVYAGRVTNWRSVGGPDREIHVVTGPSGTPNRRIRTEFFGGLALEGLDARVARPRDRLAAVEDRNDAIADIGGAFHRITRSLNVAVDGETYAARDPGYPTTYDERVVTWREPGPREAAVLELLLSEYGQTVFVGSSEGLLPL